MTIDYHTHTNHETGKVTKTLPIECLTTLDHTLTVRENYLAWRFTFVRHDALEKPLCIVTDHNLVVLGEAIGSECQAVDRAGVESYPHTRHPNYRF